jgi:hypothetical protein
LEAEGRRARYDHGYYDGDGGPPVQFWPAVSIMRFVSSLFNFRKWILQRIEASRVT